jgi:hypothetical protein
MDIFFQKIYYRLFIIMVFTISVMQGWNTRLGLEKECGGSRTGRTPSSTLEKNYGLF